MSGALGPVSSEGTFLGPRKRYWLGFTRASDSLVRPCGAFSFRAVKLFWCDINPLWNGRATYAAMKILTWKPVRCPRGTESVRSASGQSPPAKKRGIPLTPRSVALLV